MKPEVYGSFNDEAMWPVYQSYMGENTRVGLRDYNVDHDIDQKYHEENGVRVYENGRVVILHAPHRQPAVRDQLRNRFGIDFERFDAVKEVRYFLPDGTFLPKDRIERFKLYLYDERYHQVRVLLYRTPITYYGAHAQCVGGAPIKVKVPDHAEVSEVMEKLKPTLALARTYWTLEGGVDKRYPKKPGGYYDAKSQIKHLTNDFARACAYVNDIKLGQAPQADNPLLLQFGDLLYCKVRVRNFVEEQCLLDTTVPYLNYERKEKKE